MGQLDSNVQSPTAGSVKSALTRSSRYSLLEVMAGT
jgi:hypothetical protein